MRRMWCQTSGPGLHRRNAVKEVIIEKEGRYDSLDVTARSCPPSSVLRQIKQTPRAAYL